MFLLGALGCWLSGDSWVLSTGFPLVFRSSDGCFWSHPKTKCCDLIGRGSKRRVSVRFMKSPFIKIQRVINYPHGLPVVPHKAVPEVSKGREYNPEENVPIESFVTTLMDWTFPRMTWTKLASVGFVAARNCMRQQVLDDAKSLPNCGRSQSATTCHSSYAPNSAQYCSVPQSTTKHYSSTTKYYKVLFSATLQSTTNYYSVLQSTILQYDSVLQRILQSAIPYYKVLVEY